MSGTIRKNIMFESRMNVLRHCANRHPAWVGREELSKHMVGTERTHQRTLNDLVNMGYLERDNSNPAGYRLIKGRFKEFQGL